MLLRQLEYLVALARERHFARAAEACYVSQPALSEAIRKLEEELNAPLVLRGRKFEGLTTEGERVVVWAQRILADRDAMTDEVLALRHGLSGRLRLGAVPTASTALSLLTEPFCAEHPLVTVQVQADLRAEEIIERLLGFELDAGLTYLDPGLTRRFQTVALYRERYVLLTSLSPGTERLAELTWLEASRLPLCLLDPVMQGRRVLDAVFEKVGAPVRPRVETDSVASLFAHVRTGRWSCIVPHAWLHVFGIPAGMQAVPLVEPVHTQRIGLVAYRRSPESVMTQALLAVARHSKMASVLERVPS